MNYLGLYGNVPSLVGGERYRGLQRKLDSFVLLTGMIRYLELRKKVHICGLYPG
jgi:hypothetical protein